MEQIILIVAQEFVTHQQLGACNKHLEQGQQLNSAEDIYHADLFLVIGANPTNAHPVTGAKIKQQAMKVKNLSY